MEVTLGKEGLTKSWQAEFPETTECVHCKGESRVGFTVIENFSGTPGEGHVCDLYENEGKGNYWLHDVCSVAIYFCKDCLKTTSLYNQA